jgi:tetratricopeptide (TPR) repeat protein
MTGAIWRSAMVAALFALHPLHVESVAWVSERKDVLSGFFFLLTLWAYTRYANPKAEEQRRNGEAEKTAEKARAPFLPFSLSPFPVFYFLALFFFALGLLSKPMLVTLPFVLLLLDIWPLQRISRFTIHDSRRLLLEKIPFFALAAALSIVTFLVQKREGAVMAFDKLPLVPRIANAFVAYIRYLAKTVWPESLAPFYTYEINLPAWQVLGAAVLLAAITAVSLWRLRRAPYLLVGWFWFLGMLVPVIGFVQVGSQSMADRYTYLPHIGLFIALVWGISELFAKRPARLLALRFGAAALLVGCVITTALQVRHWQNSQLLFTHAIEVTRDNYPAYNNLGTALHERDRFDEAERYFQNALEI